MPAHSNETSGEAFDEEASKAALLRYLRSGASAVSHPESNATIDPPLVDVCHAPLAVSAYPPAPSEPASSTWEFRSTSSSYLLPAPTHTMQATSNTSYPTPQGENSVAFILPAMSELFTSGSVLEKWLRKVNLPCHWLEVIPPGSRVPNTWKQLENAHRNPSAPITSLPKAFIAVLCEQYRNAIMNYIEWNPDDKGTFAKLKAVDMSRNVLQLESEVESRAPNLEEIMWQYSNDQPALSVEIWKVKFPEPRSGQGTWTCRARLCKKEGNHEAVS